MSTDDQVEGEEALSAAEAFSLLDDSTRIDILLELDDVEFGRGRSFSALRAAVGTDDSSQFNYHLQRLVPQYVSKGDGGYRLTAAGSHVVRTVRAGSFNRGVSLDPFEVESRCHACGNGTLRARYADEHLALDCPACGERILRVGFPPSAVLTRDEETVVDAFDRWARQQTESATRDVCLDCGGPVRGEVTTAVPDDLEFEVLPRYVCRTCRRHVLTSFGAIAYRLPAVEGFHRRSGVDLSERRYWEVEQLITDEHTVVRSRDPWRVEVSFLADGDVCRVTFDGELDVVETAVSAE